MELVVAFVVAVIVTPIAARVARRAGIVDMPGPLKTQRVPVPYLGGMAVFAGTVVGVVVAGRPLLVVPMALALALGVADDARPVPPAFRLAAEVGIALVAAVAVPGDALTRLATAGLLVVLLNAMNLLDGQDGLASGVALVSALAFAVLGGAAGPVGLALAGALGGFLVFNRPPARIYLGDGGAYLVGTALALLPALTHEGASSWSVWLTVPLLVGVPLADTAIAVVRRLREGRPLFVGDRSHVYDQLVDRGLSVTGSTCVCVAAQVALAGAGVLAAGLEPSAAFAATVIGVLAVAALAAGCGLVGPTRVEGAP